MCVAGQAVENSDNCSNKPLIEKYVTFHSAQHEALYKTVGYNCGDPLSAEFNF